ncbi:MAG: T9SS type A sorting domain-containing protein [Bacteroidota bacterium]
MQFYFSLLKYFFFTSLFIFAFSCTEKTNKKLSEFEEGEEYLSIEKEEGHQLTTLDGLDLLNLPASQILSNYTNIGIKNYAGRTTCLIIDKADTNHLIAGAATGGLWNSWDNGSHWQPIQDNFYPMNVICLAQNPLRPQYIYYSTLTDLKDSTGAQTIDLLRSTDGGLTFHYLPAPTPISMHVRKIVCSPVDSNTLYISGFPGPQNAVYRSTDNGNSFKRVSPLYPSSYIFDLKIFPSGRVLYTVNTGAYQSLTGDSGTFVSTNNGLPATVGEFSVDYCQSDPDIVYAMITAAPSTMLYKSIDGGYNWVSRDTIASDYFTNLIYVVPDQPDFIYFGGVALRYSTDGGLTSSSALTTGADYWTMVFNPLNPSRVWAQSDFGVTSFNVGAALNLNWNPRDTTYYNQQCYFGDYLPSGNAFIAGFQDLGTKFIDSTGLFHFIYGGDGSCCFSHKQDPKVAYYNTNPASNGLKRDTNIYLNSVSSSINIYNQMDANGDGYIDDNMGVDNLKVLDDNSDVLFYPTGIRVWRSVDRGDNWVPLTSTYNFDFVNAFDVSNGADPTAYYGYDSSLVVIPHAITSSPGQEFKIPFPCSVYRIHAALENDSMVEVTTLCGDLLLCDNVFAASPLWMDISGNLPAGRTFQDLIIDPDNPQLMIGAFASGLYITANGGTTWTRETSLPPVIVQDLRLRQSDRKLFIFTYGRGIWTADLPLPTSVSSNKEQKNKYFNCTNPVNDNLILNFLKSIPDATLEIYNMNGDKIYTSTVTSSTSHHIDMRKNAAGIYIISLRSSSGKLQTEKVVKL